jgi:hypothetical protein
LEAIREHWRPSDNSVGHEKTQRPAKNRDGHQRTVAATRKLKRQTENSRTGEVIGEEKGLQSTIMAIG